MGIISKKGFMVGMGLMLATFLVSGCAGSESKKTSGDKKVKVGVVQLVEHAALDAANKGFIKGMGISAEPRDVVISSDALNYYLQKIRPQAKLYILGTEELKETIRNAGFTIIEDEQTTPDFVIVGFDMSLEYKTLAHSCRLIDKGVPFIATHSDVRCPIENGEFIPDCGAMLALIKSATGKEPVNIMGKPNHYIIDLVREKANYEKDEIAMEKKCTRNVIELSVESGSFIEGKMIKNIPWPEHTLLVDVKRGENDIVPSGDTKIIAGDYLYVLTDTENCQRVRELVEK